MPHTRDDAICLRRWDWSETSQIGAMLTKNHGLIRALAKGSRRDRSPFSGGLEPLTRGEMFAIVRPNRDLATMTAWDLTDPALGFRRDLSRFRAGCVAADLALHLIHDADPHPDAFDAVASLLAELGARETPTDHQVLSALAIAQATLLSAVGLQPDLSPLSEEHANAEAIGFDPEAGTLVPDPGAAGDSNPLRPTGPTGAPWRVRSGTLAYLQNAFSPSLGDQVAPSGWESDPSDATRANLFLNAWAAFRIGRRLPTTPELLRLTGSG